MNKNKLIGLLVCLVLVGTLGFFVNQYPNRNNSDYGELLLKEEVINKVNEPSRIELDPITEVEDFDDFKSQVRMQLEDYK